MVPGPYKSFFNSCKLFHVEHFDRPTLDSLVPSSESAGKIIRFSELLLDWNSRINLVSRNTTPQALWENHIFDCLYANSRIPASPAIIDIGSGAGFPGLVLAMARPDTRVVLIDSRQKPCKFLDEMANSLGLLNVTVRCDRIEELRPETFRLSKGGFIGTSRAYSPIARMLTEARSLFCGGEPLYYLGSAETPLVGDDRWAIGEPLEYYPGHAGRVIRVCNYLN